MKIDGNIRDEKLQCNIEETKNEQNVLKSDSN